MATKKRGESEGTETTTKKARRTAEERPRIRASHRNAESKTGAGKARPAAGSSVGRGAAAGARGSKLAADASKGPRAARPPRSVKPPPSRKAPLAPPRRTGARRNALPDVVVEISPETRDLALRIAAAGMDKKAIGIEILEVAGKVDYADFLVVMTGRSDRHVQSLAAGIEEALRQRKVRPLSIEGLASASWVLIDFGDVVVHVFQEETRQIYDIEGLWIDANRVPVPDADVADRSGLT